MQFERDIRRGKGDSALSNPRYCGFKNLRGTAFYADWFKSKKWGHFKCIPAAHTEISPQTVDEDEVYTFKKKRREREAKITFPVGG